MKTILVLLLMSCSFITYAQDTIPSAEPGAMYGKEVTEGNAITVSNLEKKLQVDSLYQGQIEGTVVEVCKKKGCFMQLKREDVDDPILVRFKDYGFFMPQNIVGRTVLIQGIAKVKETSVERQKHWAQDAGKKPDEIAGITAPKRDIEIMADGVMVLK
ncbi:DUF4920 domain-containing protein [Olivibacter sp. SDN3]|uniref:DUF4920 domain-containing protein n=1 Tax=Olivibacter sp. SDN3 TaxID=2764720 RepID=UPI0016516F90|nr:DUF4920 domain-containing protein [Olivibacter sp. SDN3]QNL51491.1 DUF4920 domain-containing protein [Olivibacter sp. SDN3]